MYSKDIQSHSLLKVVLFTFIQPINIYKLFDVQLINKGETDWWVFNEVYTEISGLDFLYIKKSRTVQMKTGHKCVYPGIFWLTFYDYCQLKQRK